MTSHGHHFLKCLSQAIQHRGLGFADFARARNYADFRIDIAEVEDPVSIGTAALSGLCDPDDARNMNAAVIDAVVLFFVEYCIAQGMNPQPVALVVGIRRVFPAKTDAEYRACLANWLESERRAHDPQAN